VTLSRRFIPLTSIRDIVITEALRRWDIRYYLAVVHEMQSVAREEEFMVPFENTQLLFPILKEVYHGLRETLYDEYDDRSASDAP